MLEAGRGHLDTVNEGACLIRYAARHDSPPPQICVDSVTGAVRRHGPVV